ncbi:MAG TPA: bifunctional isocitrate dehydrogenase kinase/phosphatase [Anaeromyxobacteraceae bacterium]|nr:bifunctional isocitrate dehydrogenase kinase/phosphatase [Anaeromyxobacteraceae bacterium]
MLNDSHAALARWAAATVREAYASFQLEFRHITRRAKLRFEARDWRGAHADALERLELHPRAIARAVDELRGVLGAAATHPLLREELKAHFERELGALPDPELGRTFYNSVARRIFGTIGVNPRAEFTAADPPPGSVRNAASNQRVYPCRRGTEELVRALLEDYAFATPYRDLPADARLVAAKVDAYVRSFDDARTLDAVEMLRPVFYRGKGAYLVGRLRRGGTVSPFILALLHGDEGIFVDAALTAPYDASVVFSFTRSYFHVEVEGALALIGFLKSILPQKPTSELYIAIGHNKHGKTVLYREILEQLARTDDRFERARGDRGMVMIVFTLPSLDVVFKVIRDRFAPPKSVTRKEVMQKYALVFRHDRAGRLVDAQEFEHLVFERTRFSEEVLDEMLREAGETVRVEGERVFIRHLYAERRLTPLNLFIRERDEWSAREALRDYGQALRDLAATNTFPGDLLLKNFGVTRNGRVIFYDYDELCLVTDCNFRDIPRASGDEDETGGEPWFYVGENDVFPEEFLTFLGLPERLRNAFLAAHGEILTADFWRRMQARHRAGEIVDIFPYRESRRLRREPPAP